MKKALYRFIFFGVLISQLPLFTAFSTAEQRIEEVINLELTDTIDLKKQVFHILDLKCNACHRKQNPFRVFSLKNMERHAARIYKQVFVLRRMPKGNGIILTEQEYQTLKRWLKTLNTY